MTPVSDIYWHVPGYVIFWGAFAIAFGFFVQRMALLLRLISLGGTWEWSKDRGQRITSMLDEVFLQRCNLKTVTREDLSGIGHALMFWGFGLFLIGYIIFIGFAGGFGLSSVLAGSAFEAVYAFLLDIAGIVVLAAIVWAMIRRYVLRPERLEATLEAGVILVLITLLMLLHFCIEAFGYSAYHVTTYRAPLGDALARILTSAGISTDTLASAHTICWWLHYFILLGFMVYIPRSKHLHILTSPFNVLYKTREPKGALRLVDPEKNPSIGAGNIEHFHGKHLLDLFSCAECGRCQVNCPAAISGKPLNPKQVIHNLKEHLLEVGPGLLKGQRSAGKPGKRMIDDVITEEVVWDCTTCGACQEICPVSIEQMTKLVEMRRSLVEQGRVSPSVTAALDSMRSLGNPWERPQSARLDWAEGRKARLMQEQDQADVLYWVGCAGAYDPRSREISLAMMHLLEKAGIDYALLGLEERCCGDPARRMGEEGLFQKLALDNIATLKKYRFKRIMTHCPHCFNMLKNEYPQLGGHFEVVHHSQVLLECIQSGKIPLAEGQEFRVTYHDPCYLGRYNETYQPPRQVLQAIPKSTLVEMGLHHSQAMCCGAGGGQIWIQAEKGRRIEDMRFEQVQALPDVSVVTTACPYCAIMLDAAAQLKDSTGKIKVMDLAELVNKVSAP